MLDRARLAELHSVAIRALEGGAGRLREQLPGPPAEHLLERHVDEAQSRSVGMDAAILPIHRDEGLVDLLEQGTKAVLALPRMGRGAHLAEGALDGLDLTMGSGFSGHADLAAAVATELEVVHQAGDDEQPAAVVGREVGQGPRVEDGDVESSSAVFDERDEPLVGELQGDPDVVGGAAVADGVGAGFLDAEHDVVDEITLRAILTEIVAQALASAQEMGALRWDPELQPRRRLGRCSRLRHVPPQ